MTAARNLPEYRVEFRPPGGALQCVVTCGSAVVANRVLTGLLGHCGASGDYRVSPVKTAPEAADPTPLHGSEHAQQAK